jgi:hypothetical protein
LGINTIKSHRIPVPIGNSSRALNKNLSTSGIH